MAVAEAKRTKKIDKEPEFDASKEYVFELVSRHDGAQPREKGTGGLIGSGFQPFLTLANSGLAYDEETGRVRAWRLITGQESIWEDEQEGFERYTPQQLNRLLSEPSNEITFFQGRLHVRGVDQLKLKALTIMDEYEGKETQYKNKNRVFKMLNADREAQDRLRGHYSEFYAVEKAIKATEGEMLSFALILGINIENQTEEGIKSIRTQFVEKAKESPEYFNKWYDSPKNKIKFAFFQGFKKGIISSTQTPNMVTWVEGKVPVYELNPSSQFDATTQLLDKVLQKDKAAMEFYKSLQQMLEIE
jgi:hypothetical protein